MLLRLSMETMIHNTFAPVDLENQKEGLGAFALYLTHKEAELAVNALERNGFSPGDISLLAPQRSGSHDFVYHQPPSFLMGAAIGGLLGLILLGFVGFLFGSREVVNMSGISPFQVKSPLMLTLVFSLIGLALGSVCGVLVGIGSPKSAAKRYGFYLKEGGIVLVVHLKNAAEKLLVGRIFEKTKGQDINVLEESKIWSTIIPEKNRLVFH